MKKTALFLIGITFSLLTAAQQPKTMDIESDKAAVKSLIERFLTLSATMTSTHCPICLATTLTLEVLY